MRDWLQSELERGRLAGRERCLAVTRALDRHAGICIEREGRLLVNFSSNDYLGLSRHPVVIAAALAATEDFGVGSGASRLISGNLEIHEVLEREIAGWKGTEAALLFNSGYHANIGVIPALAEAGDAIISDELNHASLIDGCRLSSAKKYIFIHNNLNHLEAKLNESESARRRLIVTESVFSMDGDLCPLKELLELAEHYDAWVYLDEAHAVGVLGETGAGLVEKINIPSRFRERLVQMGTLGKALGGFGAYIAGSELLKSFLLNRARSFIFTTALPPAVVGAATAAVRLMKEKNNILTAIDRNISYFNEMVSTESTAVKWPSRSQSAIIPIFLGTEAEALLASDLLLHNGFFVQAIRPPTVPVGTSRLRLTLSALHTESQISALVTALALTLKY